MYCLKDVYKYHICMLVSLHLQQPRPWDCSAGRMPWNAEARKDKWNSSSGSSNSISNNGNAKVVVVVVVAGASNLTSLDSMDGRPMGGQPMNRPMHGPMANGWAANG